MRSNSMVLLSLAMASAAWSQSSWQMLNPNPSYSPVMSVEWNGGRLEVAHGSNNVIHEVYSSPDGKAWTLEAAKAPKTVPLVHQITRMGDRWAALSTDGEGDIYISTDSVKWTKTRSGAGFPPVALAWTGTMLVAIGPGNKVITSPDGMEWTSRNIGADVNLGFVAWANSKILAIGAVGAAGTVVTSSDAVAWSVMEIEPVCRPYETYWTGSHVVTHCNNGKIFASWDFVEWRDRTPAGSSPINRLYRAGSVFVAFANNGAWTSTDGLTWDARETRLDGVVEVTYNEGVFVALGPDRDRFSYSADGISWTYVPGRNLISRLDLSAITWTGEIFIATSVDGNTIYSKDGLEWTEIKGGIILNAVASSGKVHVVVGDNAYLASSTDGINWTARHSPETPNTRYKSIAWSGSLFVASSNHGLATSADGITWTRPDIDPKYELRTVAWTGQEFVVAGPADLYTSWNGIAWPRWTDRPVLIFKSMVWTGEKLIGVGSGGGASTSVDGIKWTPPILVKSGTVDLRSVAWTGYQAVAVGYHAVGYQDRGKTAIFTSKDGLQWTEAVLPTSSSRGVLNAVAAGAGKVVAVGDGGFILVSGLDSLPGGVGIMGGKAFGASRPGAGRMVFTLPSHVPYKASMAIHALSGRRMEIRPEWTSRNQITLTTAGLDRGVYFLKVTAPGESWSQRFHILE